MLFKHNPLCRRIALLLLVSFVSEIFFPSVALALTGGPGQPEFSSFEPVSSSNMVNEFTGDFTYNLPVIQVPGPHGSGYSLSLSYHSGASPEEESSWVGYGWTLNPGAINRTTRGLPDDYKGKVTYWNKAPTNWTVSAGGNAGIEIFGADVGLRANASAELRYNNFRGFGYSYGYGLSHKVGLSLGMNVSDGQKSYSASFNPMAMLQDYAQDQAKASKNKQDIQASGVVNSIGRRSGFSLLGGNHAMFAFAESVKPTQIQAVEGKSFTASIGVQYASSVPLGPTTNITGSYAYRKNIEERSIESLGFLYTGDRESYNEPTITDYYTEKETPFQKRDVNLGIPFNNADNFLVSGEGVGGGFRMYHREIGEFTPNSVKSELEVYAIGGEVTVGGSIGAGWDASVGKQSTEVTGWKVPLRFSKLGSTSVDEPVFFRFNNDLGGEWNNSVGDEFEQVKLRRQSGSKPNYDIGVISSGILNDEQRSGRSSYIGFNMNKDLHSNSRKAYSRQADIERITTRSENTVANAIGELSVTNESGQRYVYGLPLYNRNESSLMYGVGGEATYGNSNYLIYSESERTKIGQEMNGMAYANTFLLTEITSPDYIDRTLDGPTPEDFGGYTVFGYDKVYGFNKSQWYRWRTPYTGLLYQRGSLSDPKDDMGSASTGEKEIAYLKYVKTKSHIAIFYTSNRFDGKDAADGALARKNSSVSGSAVLKKLDRIDLYPISDVTIVDGVPVVMPNRNPIKSVRFEYDYQGWGGIEAWGANIQPGIPNNLQGTTQVNGKYQNGKLMLTRVWFEYNGVAKGKVSPYDFKYTYPKTYPLEYSGLVKKFFTNGIDITDNSQTPSYSPFAIDAWGSYQDATQGRTRYSNLQEWINQNPAASFDPAAWQLKVISLPSGGEIHVQYEQDDYAYVQDKLAHVMVPLKQITAGKYYLNVAETGIKPEDIVIVKNMINRYYDQADKKMYFKFLYRLLGDASVDLTDCNAEYMTGYGSVLADIDSNGLFLKFKQGQVLPSQICRDFVKTQRLGNINRWGNCDPSAGAVSNNGNALDMVYQVFSAVVPLPGNELCTTQNPQLSYFRIPFIKNKKGGGLRVQRLLTYDKGLDGKPVLYGNEYIYKQYDENLGIWRSSGVATNEPGSMREENALVEYLPRKGQSWGEKIIAGEDLQQYDGPLGESVMPGSSVGYSRVLVRNIHRGKTNTGLTVKEFYTAKDYPVWVDKSAMQLESSLYANNSIFYNTSTSRVWASQGYVIVHNNMHGQVKRVATYSGEYKMIPHPEVPNTEIPDPDISHAALASEVLYDYFEPRRLKNGKQISAEAIPMRSEQDGEIIPQYPGKETDVTLAHKAVRDYFEDVSTEVDFDLMIFALFPIPLATWMASYTENDAGLYTYATSKVVRYPAIVKRVRSFQNGVSQTVEYQAFDVASGTPVVTKTVDDVKGSYYSRESMAAWMYPMLGPKYKNERVLLTNLSSTTDQNRVLWKTEGGDHYLDFSNLPEQGCKTMLDHFSAGDMVLVNETFLGHIDAPKYGAKQIKIYKTTITESVNTIPGTSTVINTIEILRSGRSNMVSTKAGQILTHTLSDTYTIPAKGILDATGPFEAALNGFVANLNQASVTLNGPFENMNISYFRDKIIQEPYKSYDLTSCKIKEVIFKKTYFKSGYRLELASFKIVGSNGAELKIE